jgi:hypothetical protein
LYIALALRIWEIKRRFLGGLTFDVERTKNERCYIYSTTYDNSIPYFNHDLQENS